MWLDNPSLYKDQLEPVLQSAHDCRNKAKEIYTIYDVYIYIYTYKYPLHRILSATTGCHRHVSKDITNYIKWNIFGHQSTEPPTKQHYRMTYLQYKSWDLTVDMRSLTICWESILDNGSQGLLLVFLWNQFLSNQLLDSDIAFTDHWFWEVHPLFLLKNPSRASSSHFHFHCPSSFRDVQTRREVDLGKRPVWL